MFLCSSCWQFSVLSGCSHGAHNACTALSQHSHCAYCVLKMQWHQKECHTISVQMPQTTTAFAQVLMRCRRPYCVAMVTLWRPHCSLIRAQSDRVCFEQAQIAGRRSEFYGIPQTLLAMQLRCWGNACDRTAVTSAFCIFSWTPWDRRENTALVWQGFKDAYLKIIFLISQPKHMLWVLQRTVSMR